MTFGRHFFLYYPPAPNSQNSMQCSQRQICLVLHRLQCSIQDSAKDTLFFFLGLDAFVPSSSMRFIAFSSDPSSVAFVGRLRFFRKPSLVWSSFSLRSASLFSVSCFRASRIASMCRAFIILDSIWPSFSAWTMERMVVMLSCALKTSMISIC